MYIANVNVVLLILLHQPLTLSYMVHDYHVTVTLKLDNENSIPVNYVCIYPTFIHVTFMYHAIIIDLHVLHNMHVVMNFGHFPCMLHACNMIIKYDST